MYERNDVNNSLLSHLFRTEFYKMVAVISKGFGLQHLEIAEDIVSETFLTATEAWQAKIPPNPTAWLYAVARQKTLYHFRRNKIFRDKVLPRLSGENINQATISEPDFSDRNIQDSQLRMMFAICHPAIRSEAQIGLALRILCGFSIDEIADAFFSNKEAIAKRLFRAKEKLKSEAADLALPSKKEIDKRLDNVLHTIYLLFNEGYYSATQNQTLRKDLCFEALRLGLLLTQYKGTNLPKTNALVALMCFHASRFDARQNSHQDMILYEDQDEALWNKELIAQGNTYLRLSAQGSELSSYHLEAGIAFWHCIKEDEDQKWQSILHHYDLLLAIHYSPAGALNRIYALYKLKGKEMALTEAETLVFSNNHFYFTLLGELYQGVNNEKAKACLQKALTLAKTQTDKQIIQARIYSL